MRAAIYTLHPNSGAVSTLAKLKVLFSVIVAYTVYVMDLLGSQKWAAEYALHDDPVFQN